MGTRWIARACPGFVSRREGSRVSEEAPVRERVSEVTHSECRRSGPPSAHVQTFAYSLKRLPNNFKCADVICDFCGYLAQVKAASASDVEKVPRTILGAAWGPQRERMDAGIYFPLFLVLVDAGATGRKRYSIHYLPADLQSPEMFRPRNPLSPTARRKGWRGFIYNLDPVHSHFVRLC